MTPRGDAGPMVCAAIYTNPYEAYTAQGLLGAHGLASYVYDDQVVRLNWLWSNAVGGVKVMVAAQDLSAAKAVLQGVVEPEALPPVDPNPRCPRCSSLEVFRRQKYEFAFLTWFVLGFPVFPVFRRWVCQRCGFRWKRSSGTPRDGTMRQ